MRKLAGVVVLLFLVAMIPLVMSGPGTEAGQATSTAVALGACERTTPALGATAARPCVIRCSDLTGCQRCCPSKGGWVCTPI